MTAGISRRTFLRGVGAATALAWAGPLLVPRFGRAALDPAPFEYGVASGDPLSNRVVIWTRVTTASSPEPVSWQVSTDPTFSPIVASGTVDALAGSDWTVKVDVTGLASGTTYYYRFGALSATSPVGRTRTAPEGSVSQARFAVASCQDYQAGYYAAWAHIAARDDIDAVIFLGDYIYEYPYNAADPNAVVTRPHDPLTETLTLDHYRRRYRTYRSDDNLREAHRRHPFISVWDDHEVANDRWGAGSGGAENHTPATEGTYLDRQAAAYQAYFEWVPVRPSSPPLYRQFAYGSLIDLFMLDTRTYRDQPKGSLLVNPLANLDPAIMDPARTILGQEQKDAFKTWLASSTATWRVVGNQVMIAPLKFGNVPDEVALALSELTGEPPLPPYKFPRDGGIPVNYDQWDDYQPERREILEFIRNPNGDVSVVGRALGHKDRIRNVVFLTGDIHTSWAFEVPVNPGNYPAEAPVAVEFVGPSITSINLNELVGTASPAHTPLPHRSSAPVEAAAISNNPYLKYVELDSNGYMIVDATPARVRTEYYNVTSSTERFTPVKDPVAGVQLAPGGTWQVLDGTSRLLPTP